jgi:acylphosphatase
MSDVIRHVVFQGRVQGVGYRAFVEQEAMRKGLAGWVRNRRDGTVEALFSGPEPVVRAMIEACRKGPLGARVEAIYEQEGSPQELAMRGAERFSVLSTV